MKKLQPKSKDMEKEMIVMEPAAFEKIAAYMLKINVPFGKVKEASEVFMSLESAKLQKIKIEEINK